MAKRLPLVFEGGEIIESKSTDTMDLNSGVVKSKGGTTERKLADILGDALSVKDFGAKGDGTTDDTAAFVAAANHGGVIYVPHGEYVITDAVQGDFISFGHPSFTGAGAATMSKNCTDLYDDYVHKNQEYLPSNQYEQIYGDKQALGKWNFKGQTIFEGNENHSGTETHSGDVTYTGNVNLGSTGGNADKKVIINNPTEFKTSVRFIGLSDEDKANLLNDLITGGANDGFEIASGKLKVKASELIPGTDTDGLVVENGKIKVKPTELAGNGLSGNDETGKLAIKLSDLIPGTATDGFEIVSNKLKVKPAEFAGDGLLVDDGKLAVDIAEIAAAISSDDAVNSSLMLAALGLPVSLASDESEEWFVNYEAANASDSPTYAQLIASANISAEDAEKMLKGKSTSKKADKAYMTAYRWGTNENYPFKTISEALKFIRTHYNLSNVNSYITITPRTATSGDDSYYSAFLASSYGTGGGTLCLQSSNPNKKVIIQKKADSGYVAQFTNSDYNGTNLHFKFIWHGNATKDISTAITRIVDVCNNSTTNLTECEYTLEDRTKTSVSGADTYSVTSDNVTTYKGIAGTRLIHAKNGGTLYLHGGTFNIIHPADAFILASDGQKRGQLFYSEISSYIGFTKINKTYTFTGSCATLFVATRQSMIGGYGSDTPTLNFTNFETYKLFNCQNASGYERNGFVSTSEAQSIAVPSGLTRPSDTFVSGSWYDGYVPYTAN